MKTKKKTQKKAQQNQPQLFPIIPQAALETVRCEELQLELSAALKTRSSTARQPFSSILTSSAGSGPTTVTWAPTPTLPSHQKQQQQQNSEVDRIMAKIEQARLSLANVCGRQTDKTKQYHKQKKKTTKYTLKQTFTLILVLPPSTPAPTHPPACDPELRK